MKKILSLCLGLLLSILFGLSTHVLAQSNTSLDSWLSSILGGFGNFGYIGTNISVQSISSTGVVIESPVIRDESQQDVLKYVIWYGPYPFGKLLDGSSGVSTSDFQSKEFVFSSHSEQTFVMILTEQDGLIPNQLYYATVVPIALNGDSGEMSGPDICFRIIDGQSAVGMQCNSLGSNVFNSAGGANLQLANISNTCNNNQITLTWNSVPGAEQVRIYRVTNGQLGTLLSTRNMNAQTYTFPLRNPTGVEVVRFIPIDSNGNPSGSEYDYTLRLCDTQSTMTPVNSIQTQNPRPGVSAVPKVGPKEDIAYVILASLFIYGLIKVKKYRKAK